jgi:hypothetical protein
MGIRIKLAQNKERFVNSPEYAREIGYLYASGLGLNPGFCGEGLVTDLMCHGTALNILSYEGYLMLWCSQLIDVFLQLDNPFVNMLCCVFVVLIHIFITVLLSYDNHCEKEWVLVET